MKIVLPSKGILGLRSVELRPPTFNDLRNVYNLNQQEGLLKAQFVKRLLGDVDLNKITKFDLDYLYIIAAYSLTFNKVSFKIQCPFCKKEVDDFIMFGDQDVVELKLKDKQVTKEVDGEEVTFRIMSAQDEINAWEYALTQENEESAYTDACVSIILHGDVSHAKEIGDIPATLYITAMAFQYYNFHGVILKAPCECSNCHKTFKVRLTPSSELVKVDLNQLMTLYAEVSDKVTFDDFCSLSINEFYALKKALG